MGSNKIREGVTELSHGGARILDIKHFIAFPLSLYRWEFRLTLKIIAHVDRLAHTHA